MISALDHVVIAVRDLEAGIAAYQRLLGRPPCWRADAADGGAEKLARIAGLTPVVRAFSIARQSGALGIDKAVHVIIGPGPHANRFLREIERLAGFREVARPGAAA